MRSFEGKVIAITGAASGIALALTLQLAELGARLSLADLQEQQLHQLIADLKGQGVDAIGTKLDVSSSQQVNDWIAATVGHFGKLDGAANIAGIELGFTNIEDLTDAIWDKMLAVNLSGVMYCVRAEIRAMNNGGSIVNAASLAGIMGRPGIGAYACSKHGVVGLTKTAAKEVGIKGIRVNAVAPGPVQTPMLDSLLKSTPTTSSSATTQTYLSLPLQRKGEAIEVAKTIAFLLSDESSFTTGVVYSVDGGAAA
ncbi:oxidoreductase [Pyrenochaeta sp. DS3sAY3a]|nr:oxidoreductase [Pyrenochaeta sp. DS3sAY3a]